MKRPNVPWLTMGPDPHLASCARCGRTVPQPPLPMDMRAFVRYMDAFGLEHADCQEPSAVREATR